MSYHGWQSAGRVGILAVSFGLAAALSARADCPPEWLPGEGVPGLDGPVYATTTWDPDGPGGQPELLVVGGAFTVAGDVIANNIAAWDGTTWQPLGSGTNDVVLTLTVYNGDLVAGGWFTTAGGNPASRIARWNGTTWQPLGSGMTDWVWALTVYNGELIAGGWFTTAGGNPASYIARWNGATWQPLGSGMNNYVLALTVYPPQAAELIAGGYFTTAGGQVSAYWARWACAHGACCHADGSCAVTTEADCTGIWHAEWADCDMAECPQPTAACCYPDGSCAVTTGADCTGVWHAEWADCNVAECPQPTGACCLPGSECEILTPEECAALDGHYKGHGTTCESNACVCRGDLNCDGVVDFADINPFVLILTNPWAWQQTYAGCPWQNGDIDGNGAPGFEDINPFVALIVQAPIQCQY